MKKYRAFGRQKSWTNYSKGVTQRHLISNSIIFWMTSNGSLWCEIRNEIRQMLHFLAWAHPLKLSRTLAKNVDNWHYVKRTNFENTSFACWSVIEKGKQKQQVGLKRSLIKSRTVVQKFFIFGTKIYSSK